MPPADQVRDVALGYLVQGDLLVHKWVPSDGGFVGEEIFQVVMPKCFHDVVQQTAHDACGHLGIKKTYYHVLRYLFGLG